MLELLQFISYVVSLYEYVVIASVIFSWLIAFNVMNPYNPVVKAIWDAVQRLTEPLLRPIRRMMPDLGGLDLSPIILLLACFFIRSVLLPNIARLVV